MSTYKVNIPAGPIWNQKDAEEKAPKVAAAHQGKWTGQWNTVVESQMSVIEVELNVANTGANEFKTNVLAGPIWSNDEAQEIGKTIAASYGAEFTGEWHTVTEGVMSVIEIIYKY
ncbi:mannan-binding protein [Thalassotalea sp. PLHSN55]|uniref:mannan-binding protein n=1 Tax=Thalassotalea sp. PLHSN55 TaxID=3435888 RepID=UPI003F82D22E